MPDCNFTDMNSAYAAAWWFCPALGTLYISDLGMMFSVSLKAEFFPRACSTCAKVQHSVGFMGLNLSKKMMQSSSVVGLAEVELTSFIATLMLVWGLGTEWCW